MFAFDHWADWLQAKAEEMTRQGIACAFKDGRTRPELAANPSLALEVRTGQRLGLICFWKNGLCDLEVLETGDNTWVEAASMSMGRVPGRGVAPGR